jgi:hypothetical protein
VDQLHLVGGVLLMVFPAVVHGSPGCGPPACPVKKHNEQNNQHCFCLLFHMEKLTVKSAFVVETRNKPQVPYSSPSVQ